MSMIPIPLNKLSHNVSRHGRALLGTSVSSRFLFWLSHAIAGAGEAVDAEASEVEDICDRFEPQISHARYVGFLFMNVHTVHCHMSAISRRGNILLDTRR